ncbi:MAG: C39 family peptidase [Deltaproteobacteria bacterium]|nr:C39 family peptidase [Deltaproteobacteria bacterium]
MPRSVALFVVGCGLLACSATESPLAPAPRLALRATSDREVELTSGRARLRLAVASTLLDRIEADLRPGSTSEALVTIQHGEDGGATLLRVEGDRTPAPLLRAQRGEELGRAVFAPGGERFAVVRRLAPHRARRDEPLAWPGELWLGDLSGRLRRVASGDLAEVLGWLDDDTLVVTRRPPGDLPEARPARVDLRLGTVEELPGFEPRGHVYSAALVEGALAYVRTDERVVSGPAPTQRLELRLLDLHHGTDRLVAEERGALPIELSGSGDELRYALEGRGTVRIVNLKTRAQRTELRPSPQLFLPPRDALFNVLPMPYVHQVYDAPPGFNGSWACGPTSTLMIILAHGLLAPDPVTVNEPSAHTSEYGVYLARKYTFNGTTFDRQQNDASGKPAWGAYGWGTKGGEAWAYLLQDYATKHGLKTTFAGSTSFNAIKAHLDAGRQVVLSTALTGAGHLIAVRGYTESGALVVNDPYGNKNLGTYPNYNGGEVTYAWSQMGVKWHVAIEGTTAPPPPPPEKPALKATLLEKRGPAQLAAGATGQVTVTYRNDGASAWDARTFLGTSEPRDRQSVFYSPSWPSQGRVAPTGVVAPGGTATITFTVTAPNSCGTRTYAEHFNLVQDGVAWFSDPGQGGPADGALELALQVTPVDADGDNVPACRDCDDTNPSDTRECEKPAPVGTPPVGAPPAGGLRPEEPWPTDPTAPSGQPDKLHGGCAVGGAADRAGPAALLLALASLLHLGRATRRREVRRTPRRTR